MSYNQGLTEAEADAKYLLNSTDTFDGTLTVDGSVAVNYNTTVGTGEASTSPSVTINGATTTGYGPRLTLQRGGENKAIIGTYSGVVGGASDALALYSYDEVYLFSGEALSFVLDWKQCVGIGANWVQNCAILEIESTSKGVLFPRMTTTQRDAIPTPQNGLMIYNTTTNKFNGYAAGAWVALH